MPTASDEDFDTEFVHQPSDSLLCPVCHEVCKEALITTACSHSFCSACIYQSIQVEPLCPLCRTKVGIEGLHPNIALANIISELNVYCRNKIYGCTTVVRLDALAHHIMHCIYAPAECENKGLGCSWQGTVQSAADHLKDCVYEKLKAFIEANSARIQRLEGIVMDQQEEITKLRTTVRNAKRRSLTSDPTLSSSSTSSRRTFPEGGALVYEEEEINMVGENEETWPHGDIECRHTISEYSCGVTSLAYSRGLVYSGAHDGSTKVFKVDTGELINSLHGHQMSVWALAVDPVSGRFFSAGSDGTIKVWDLSLYSPTAADRTQQQCCIDTLRQHNGKVYSLAVRGDRLYSASSDRTIKVWDVNTLENLATFTGHQDGINAVIAIDNDRVATAASDKTVKIWDVRKGIAMHTIGSHSSEVLDLTHGDRMLFAATYDAVIHVYDDRTNERGGSEGRLHYAPVTTLTGHNWEVWQLEYTQGELFSASFDHTVRRWDVRGGVVEGITTGKRAFGMCTGTLKGHKGFVHAMIQGDNNLITGCADRTIKIWH